MSAELSAENERLKALVEQQEGKLSALAEQVDDLTKERDHLYDQVQEFREEQDEVEGEIADRIREFIAECERPVGTLNFIVPQNDRVSRAILAMNDAIGRKV